MAAPASSKEHHAKLHYGKERMLIYGVANLEEAAEVARHVVMEENCRIIELCGGFDDEATRVIKEAAGARTLVGHVVYASEDAALVAEIVEELKQLNL